MEADAVIAALTAIAAIAAIPTRSLKRYSNHQRREGAALSNAAARGLILGIPKIFQIALGLHSTEVAYELQTLQPWD